MQIYVKRINNKTITLDVKLSDTIASVKQKIEHEWETKFWKNEKKDENKELMPYFLQHLIYDGKQLADHKTLEEYNVKENKVIIVLKLKYF